jgi:hypothetical protein
MYARIAYILAFLGLSVLAAKFWRPVTKGVFRGYFAATDHLREMVAETGESVQDLYAEARSEYLRDREGPPHTEKAVEELTPKPARRAAPARRSASARKPVAVQPAPASEAAAQ